MQTLTMFQNYQAWQEAKLEKYQTNLEDCIVEIENPKNLTKNEKAKLLEIVKSNNFVIFQTKIKDEFDKNIATLNQQLGLVDYDKHLFAKNNGLSYIQKTDLKKQGEFIPYTDKELNWHTDGYYNCETERVRAFSLFCVRPAKVGGENQFIDYEMVYMLLQQQNPAIIEALEHPKAMTIPKFENRPVSTGGVFFEDKKTKKLMMRYTQRKKKC